MRDFLINGQYRTFGTLATFESNCHDDAQNKAIKLMNKYEKNGIKCHLEHIDRDAEMIKEWKKDRAKYGKENLNTLPENFRIKSGFGF
jgi:hypothetical protein